MSRAKVSLRVLSVVSPERARTEGEEMRSGCFAVVLLLQLFLSVRSAHASTELNGLFDARSSGMGGTGVAFLDSPGAIPTNPALLDQIGKLSVSLDVLYVNAQTQAPYTIYHIDPSSGQPYRNYETMRAPPTAAALPFFGMAFRLSERVIVGAAAYPVLGQGISSSFRPAPDEYPNVVAVNQAAMGLIEAAVPLTVRVLDSLSVAISWRISYMTQSISLPVPSGSAPGNPPAGVLILPAENRAVNADMRLSGVNFGGIQLGVLYRPVSMLRLGLTYRSKVVVEGTGTTTTSIGGPPTVLDTMTSYTNPHVLRAGAAVSVLNDSLLLAADFKYLLYAESYKAQRITTLMNGNEKTVVQPLNWKNAFTVQLGAEYKLTEAWRVRAGYILSSSATPEESALALAPPPGNAHLFSAGLGIKILDTLNLDVSGGYVALSTHIATASAHNAGIGTYAAEALNLGASVTYHM